MKLFGAFSLACQSVNRSLVYNDICSVVVFLISIVGQAHLLVPHLLVPHLLVSWPLSIPFTLVSLSFLIFFLFLQSHISDSEEISKGTNWHWFQSCFRNIDKGNLLKGNSKMPFQAPGLYQILLLFNA